MLPLAYDSLWGLAQQRFGSLNILNSPDLVGQINYQRGQIQNWPIWSQRLFHNKASTVAAIFMDNYFQAFSPQFLFTIGQVENPRHSLPGQGLLYWWMAPFVIHGLYAIWQTRKHPSSQLLFYWLVTAPLPAAVTIGGGQHATRLFVMIPPLVILSSLGIYQFWVMLNKNWSNVYVTGLSLLAIVGLVNYLQSYFYHYTPTYHYWWNYGMKPALDFAKTRESQDDRIIITKGFVHLPMLYYLFYNQYPPSQLQKQFVLNKQGLAPDPTGQIGKYYFSSIPPGDTYTGPRSLYVGLHEDAEEANTQWHYLGELRSPDPMDDKPVLVYLESP